MTDSSLWQRGSARIAGSIISGIALALAFPKPSIWPLALVALAPLLLALRGASSRRHAFLLGQLSMTAFWLVVMPWVVNVVSFYGGLGTPVGVALYVAMALFLGLWGGLFALILYVVQRRLGLRAWLIAPLIWATTEFGRTYLNSGFPWTLAGEAFIGATPLAMVATLVGPYALGAFAVAASAAVAYQFTEASKQKRLMVGGVAIVGLLLWLGAGSLVLMMRRASVAADTMHTAALVQPNISQEMRWNNQHLLDIFDRMVTLTERAVGSGAEVVIWPESTVPLTYMRTAFYRQFIEGLSRTSGADVILGSVAEDEFDANKIWNAAYLVTGGQTSGRYDKIRLVPFGEYVPLRKMLFFAEKMVRQVGEFQFGMSDKPLQGKFRYGPAICYEVVFPQITAGQVRNGAEVLVTVTNDAWFGLSAAPFQHLDMARMRAIETDRWMLRSATTGISAAIDPTGRVVQQLALGEQGVILARFSPRHSVTPYVRFGDWFAWVAVAVTLISLVIRRKAYAHE